MTNSQQRCVFVGNIPYDATEAQLTQICEEVGPVLSFRLVLDRETGKPKGYGFCEYRDEETAASARRNLQGYEINGRQLRVDYAENDKGTDRNREQGRGGPGLASIYDNQKQSAATFSGDPSYNHPIGIAAAAAAASIMATALGEPQTSINDQSQVFPNARNNATGVHDPLTLHLASMPKKTLLEFLSEMKALAKQNEQQAHQILTMHPSLTKAIFQAQIILGMITPQMASNFKNDIQTQTSQQVYQAPTGQTQTQSGLVDHEQILQPSPPHNVPLQHLLSSSQDLNQTKPLLNKQGPSIQQLSQSLNLPVQHTLTSQPLPGQSQPLSIQRGFGKLYSQPLSQQSRQPYPSSGHNPLFKPSGISHQRNSPPPVQASAGNANAAILPANMEFRRLGTVNNHLLRDPSLGSENLLLGGRGSSFSQVSGSRASDAPWVPTAQSKAGPVVSKGPYGTEDRISRNYISLGQNGEIGPLPTDISVTPVIQSHAVSQSIAAGIEQMQQSISEEAQFTPELQSVLLHQVMNLTQEQINYLPPDQQQQVFQVQQLAQMYQGGSSS